MRKVRREMRTDIERAERVEEEPAERFAGREED